MVKKKNANWWKKSVKQSPELKFCGCGTMSRYTSDSGFTRLLESLSLKHVIFRHLDKQMMLELSLEEFLGAMNSQLPVAR